MIHRLTLSTIQRGKTVAAGLLLLTAAGQVGYEPQRAGADTTFPQTGFTIWGPFEEYWKANGGLAQFGLPRTTVYPAGSDYDAQWFERALFTYNPSKPDPYKVELHLLGSQITEGRRDEVPFQPAPRLSEGQYFEPTGHNLSGKFLEYWESTGGLAIYGYPLSESFMERSESDGQMYMVQYFERNRFEYHPENEGTQFEVQLGLLGSELLDTQGGPSAVAALGLGRLYPKSTAVVGVPDGELVDSPNAGTPEPSNTAIPAAPALPAATGAVLFNAEFSSATLSAWQPGAAYNPPDASPASWSVTNGMLHQSGVAGEEDASPDALLLVASPKPADVTLEAQFFARGESIGLVSRWTANGYYLLRLYGEAPNTQPKAQIVRVTPQGSNVIAVSEAWGGFKPLTWVRATFTLKGVTLTAEIDGQQIISTTDTLFTTGSFGLYAYADGTARFDNIRATTP